MNDRTSIKHCMNCKYRMKGMNQGYCLEKRQSIEDGRVKAKSCRFYKEESGAE